MEILNCP